MKELSHLDISTLQQPTSQGFSLRIWGVFTAYIFDIEHPCYIQLIPVKTRYLLTSIT